jgi:transcriptional regulator with XRE-family HTH domain
MTSRPGWSIQRLADEAGIHRNTIFRWMKGTRNPTVANVRLIAAALGDDLENALRAAGNASEAATFDETMEMIRKSNLGDEQKKELVKQLLVRRDRAEQHLREDFEMIIRAAERS